MLSCIRRPPRPLPPTLLPLPNRTRLMLSRRPCFSLSYESFVVYLRPVCRLGKQIQKNEFSGAVMGAYGQKWRLFHLFLTFGFFLTCFLASVPFSQFYNLALLSGIGCNFQDCYVTDPVKSEVEITSKWCKTWHRSILLP